MPSGRSVGWAVGAILSACALARAADTAAILDQCYHYLESHLCEGEKWGKPYHFYKPSIEKYSADQWLWDSGAHMMYESYFDFPYYNVLTAFCLRSVSVWSHRNVTNSVLDLRTMLQMQRADGFIPEEIFWSDKNTKANIQTKLMYSSLQYSDITQMPVLPYSLRAIYQASRDPAHIQEFLPALVRYFQWWRATRDDGDGLVAAIHNWETGAPPSPNALPFIDCTNLT